MSKIQVSISNVVQTSEQRKERRGRAEEGSEMKSRGGEKKRYL
jgi:hypothetical protein